MSNSRSKQSHGDQSSPSTQWDIAVSDIVNKLRIWVVEHDVEMFHGANRLQGFPILEPNHLLPPRRTRRLYQHADG